MLGTIKQYKTRLSAAVAILGIAATALSYCSKSSFGYSARRTIPKLTLFFYKSNQSNRKVAIGADSRIDTYYPRLGSGRRHQNHAGNCRAHRK
ncbi:hypothetical protein LEP1GSC005_1400 [Leptospira santarosai str. ST188]|nr:hypothetical protein LEP1GSC005_1400 [Leptospira santarosai str. ST188]